jgi:hypothetical protein
VLEYCSTGVLGCTVALVRSVGVLEYWSAGVLVRSDEVLMC